MTERIPFVLKYNDWPSADRIAWIAFYTDEGIFDDEGPFRHWSEGSRTKRRQSYGQWLSFLVRSEPSALKLLPAQRVTVDRVRSYLQECETRLGPRSIAGLILDLYVLAKGLDPANDWTWLNTASRRLLRRSGAGTLAEAPPISAQRIWRWSVDRLETLHHPLAVSPMQRAIWFRQALMIGFLISRPVRRRALLAMTVDGHVTRRISGYHIAFAAQDMKDRRTHEALLPQALTIPLDRYLQVHRPILLGEQWSSFLWINQYGKPITPDGFSRELPKVTERHLGVALRPHAFRRVAATSVAETDPEHVNIIKDLLGHSTLDMAEKHYNRATGISSCKKLQSIMDDIHQEMPKMGRVKRKLTSPSRSETSR